MFAAVVFLNLGTWQINRHHEKEQLKFFIDSQMGSPDVSFRENEENLSFRKVDAGGEYLDDYILISGRYLYSKDGYGIISIFKPRHSDFHYLIDRGWIADAEFNVTDFLKNEKRIEGLLVPFDQFTKKETSSLKTKTGIPVFPYMDPLSVKLYFSERFPDLKISNFVILHGTENKKGELIEKKTDAPTSWWVLPQGDLPHLGYAITWFGLMLTSVYFLIVSYRRK